MAVLRVSLICVLYLHFIFTVKSKARKCAYYEYTIVSESNVSSCMECSSCPRGFGLAPQCGSIIKQNEMEIKCQACELGKTYSGNSDISSCQPCGTCSEHQVVVDNCTLVSNSVCNDACSEGFYYEALTGDCHACSWCCPDGSNNVKSQCKNMPPYEQCDSNSITSCKPECQAGQYVVPDSNGGHCENCTVCPPGMSPFPQCGSVVEDMSIVSCRECVEGETFSDTHGESPCKPCTRCSVGQKELVPCNLTHDRVCNDCNKGFYRDHTSECKPCSACCNDDKDVHVEKCAEQNMPKNLQCSHTNRAVSMCQQQKNKEPTQQESNSSLAVFVAGGVAVGVVTSVLAMLYWRLKYHKYKSLSTHQSVALLISPEEEEIRLATFEDPTVSGFQETLSFEKSGVVLQFSDPESFVCDAQGVRLKICWDKASVVSLPSQEVQLSPVIKFHPHGSKLSKAVCVRIPHSALVFQSHGWKIQLKSSTSNNGAIEWKDEEMYEIHTNEVSFYTDCLVSYVVVGTSHNSKPTKKRLQCAAFGGEGRVGENYTVYLYVFDDCEASLEKIMEDEKSRNRILLGSLQSLYVESVQETDIRITIKQLVNGWNIGHTNPKFILHKSVKESYKTIPCAQVLFEHDNGRNRDFRCTFELTADDATTQIGAAASIREDPFRMYKESRSGQNHEMVTGRSLCDPIISNGDKLPLPFHKLPKEIIDAVCVKLDLSLKGLGNWQQVGERLGLANQQIEGFREEFLTTGGSPCAKMLQFVQSISPQFTVAEFVQILQCLERFDVVDILAPYIYEFVPENSTN